MTNFTINLIREEVRGRWQSDGELCHFKYSVLNPEYYPELFSPNYDFVIGPVGSPLSGVTYYASYAAAVTALDAQAMTDAIAPMQSNTDDPHGYTFVGGNVYLIPTQVDYNVTDVNSPSYIKNKISIPTKSFATPSRTIGTAFQISSTRDANVVYSIPVTSNATVLAGSQASATIQYADNSGISTNVVTLPGDAFGIASGLLVSGIGSLKLLGNIPAGKYVKITTSNISGTPTLGTMTAQETLI